MPTTPNGTVYSDRTFTSSAGYTSTMLVPTHLDGTGTPIQTVLFCHGSGTGDRSRTFSDSTMLTPLKNALMDGGYMLIEGHVGGDHWGNQRAVDAYVALVTDSAKLYNPISGLIVYGRSMGGTVACHLASQDTPLKPYVTGLYLNSAVQSLYWWSFIKNGTGQPTGPAVCYDIDDPTSVTEFLAKTKGYDPMTFAKSSFTDIPVMWTMGTADATVDPLYNATALRDRIGAYVESSYFNAVAGGTHNGDTSGTYGLSAQEIAFFNKCRGDYLVPITDWTVHSQVKTHRVLDARLVASTGAHDPLSLRVFRPARTVPVFLGQGA